MSLSVLPLKIMLLDKFTRKVYIVCNLLDN